VIRLDPQDSMALINRGNAWKHKEEYDNAIADFSEAIRLRPDDIPPYFNRGVTLHLMQEYDKAISDFDEVIRLDPQFSPAYRNRGDAWNEKDEYDNAISDFDEALRLSPEDAQSHVSRGSSWRAKGDFEAALADYNAAIRIDPQNARAHNSRAWLWATCPDERFRDGRQAVESAKSACELTEWKDHRYVDTLAAAYAEVGDFDNAVKTQTQAIALAGEEAEYESRLALYQERKAFREEEPDRPYTAAELVKGNTRFAFDLYGRLRLRKQENLIFSPYSISTALAMTYGGAAGDTQAQMARVLRFPQNPDQVHAAFAQVIGRLQGPATRRTYQLHVANALWAAEHYNFIPEYFGLVEDRYRAALKTVDFGSPEEARQAINHWVEGHTQRKIRDLLKPGVLNPKTPLVLTNAIYFKAAWAHKFDQEQTKDEDFFTTGQSKTKVRMMHQSETFRYLDGGDFQLLELPYAREGLSMFVILPKQIDGLEALEKSLSAGALDRWTEKLERHSVDVSLPKFKTTAEFSLIEALESLGMRLPFDRQHADFSAMTPNRSGLVIGAVEHQAFVDVNEEGTEAAAATAVVMAPGAGAIPRNQKQAVFRADHPFMYLIRENATGSILFIGRVSQPVNN
jgi:serpin B